MNFDHVLPEALAGDEWPGLQITVPTPLAQMGITELRMRRQASADAEPQGLWSTANGTITLAASPTDANATVVTIASRVLSTPGVWYLRLLGDATGVPETYVTCLLVVRSSK